MRVRREVPSSDLILSPLPAALKVRHVYLLSAVGLDLATFAATTVVASGIREPSSSGILAMLVSGAHEAGRVRGIIEVDDDAVLQIRREIENLSDFNRRAVSDLVASPVVRVELDCLVDWVREMADGASVVESRFFTWLCLLSKGEKSGL